ncbi:hypothetical protein LHJ74_21310 [Streptomyces sp. N2-109]|uniref:DUF6801 domain-containing protein n=1 Tax=Streptomyces gossypii TaxID=2883101 RepID=A0ABT2JWZ4_9ACTN|nr:DUF6801 domain-containing protein [Streptomyces gossypii]MCT2592412.1 hypothetical protein [Streptomyces gossypii]
MTVHGKRARARISLAAATATGLAVGMLGFIGAGTASAETATLHQEYSCSFPLIGDQPIQINISAELPAQVEVGETIPPFDITSVATVPKAAADGMTLVGGKTMEGTATADVKITTPAGEVPVQVPNSIAKTDLPSPTADFDVIASGQSPQLQFNQAGQGTIDVTDLGMSDMEVKDADGNTIVFPGFPDGPFTSDCTMTSTDTTLHTFEIVESTGTSPETEPTEPGTETGTNPGTEPTAPGTEPADPATEPTAPGTAPDEEPAAPGPEPGTNGVLINFDLAGNSHIKAAKGDVALNGGIEADYDLAQGTFDADLTLDPSSGDFTVLGFLPATASVEFEQDGITTGTLNAAGDLKTSSKMYVKLPKVSILGLPVGGGQECKTAETASIELASEGRFNPLSGGKVKGEYTLPELADCGFLNDVLGAFMAGPGNTIDMDLTSRV